MASKTKKTSSQTNGNLPRDIRAARASRRVDGVRPAEEELFAKAFRSSPHPIGITELETGRCLDINDACLTLFGFRREEVIGQTTLMLGIWPDPQERARFVERLKTEGAVRNYEISMKVKSGDLRQFLISSEVITFGGKLCLVTIGNDITERKQAEEALRLAHIELEQRVAIRTDELTRANERLQTEILDRKRIEAALTEREALTGAFLDNSATVAWMKDAEGRHVYLSPSFERRFHACLEDWHGKTDYDLWPRDVADVFRANDATVLKENRVIEVVEEAMNADGSRSWWQSHKFPFQDASGKRYVGGLGVEITDRKQAEEQLRQNEERLNLAIRLAKFGVFDHDHRTETLYWSPTMQEIYGIPSDEPASLDGYIQLIHPHDREAIVAAIRRAHDPSGDGLYAVEHRLLRRDGSVRWVSLRSRTLFEGDGPARKPVRTMGAMVDITERKQSEQVLAERARLSAFAAEVSLSLNHDEPLSALLQHFSERLTKGLDVAFARIWVLRPGDVCKECYKAEWCTDRTECLHLAASAGLSTNLNGEFGRVPLGALKIGRIAQGAGAMVANDILRDERLPNKQWMKDNGLQSFAGFPLVVEGRRFGVLALFGRVAFSPETLQTIESMSHGLATAIARKQAEQVLQEKQRQVSRQQEQLRELTAKLLAAQESERRRIARDLHDDVSQRLAALVLDISSVEQQPPLLPEVTAKLLEPIREQLEQVSDDVHNLAYGLHPSLLEHAGLLPAVEDLIHQVTKRTGLPILFKVSGVPASIPREHAICLFRVLQESIQNVVKHAHAAEVIVGLSGSTRGIGLSVTDNGKGFDSRDKRAHQIGLGLISMQERLRLLHGYLRVHSRPADGTKVCAWIPFKERER